MRKAGEFVRSAIREASVLLSGDRTHRCLLSAATLTTSIRILMSHDRMIWPEESSKNKFQGKRKPKVIALLKKKLISEKLPRPSRRKASVVRSKMILTMRTTMMLKGKEKKLNKRNMTVKLLPTRPNMRKKVVWPMKELSKKESDGRERHLNKLRK